MKVNSKGLLRLLVAGIMLSAVDARGDPPPADAPAEDRHTEITSERLTFDYNLGRALFEENVHVVDPGMLLWSDRLLVHFDEEGGAARLIIAEGRVRIEQEATRAFAETARYDVATGAIVLEGEPRVHRGRDILTGRRITFWRDEQRMEVDASARLLIYPDEDGDRLPLLRE